MMLLPLGQADFVELIDSQLEFVDKSLLIKDVLLDSAKVILIARPRRFGKTLNLSMLRYFFAEKVQNRQTQGMFDRFKIAAYPSCMQYQGQYPVIALTFKDLKMPDYPSLCARFAEIIADLYEEHAAVVLTGALSPRQKKQYDAVLAGTASILELQSALKFLIRYLYQHYGKKVILLLDEYDIPIQSGYMHEYYDEAVNLIRGLLSPALKDNSDLHKAVLTGVLRVSKESLFSGFNNLIVYSVLDQRYAEYFGFTETEVESLLIERHLEHKLPDIKHWYNGYQIGDQVIYNPWSIVSCINNYGILQSYWVNTSDNVLVKRLLINARLNVKEKIQSLMQGSPIEVTINEHFVFGELASEESTVWSLLLMTGYLKVMTQKLTSDGLKRCQVHIPNWEVYGLFVRFIKEWLADSRGMEWYNGFLEQLLNGEVSMLEVDLQSMMESIASVHDMAREPEAFYQGFLLGLTACLHRGEYAVQSNRESGYGRYDIAVIPKDREKIAVLMELKSIAKPSGALDDALITGAEAALTQIEERHYIADLRQLGIRRICKIGIAMYGKQVKVKYSTM